LLAANNAIGDFFIKTATGYKVIKTESAAGSLTDLIFGGSVEDIKARIAALEEA
jgi:hypothetical protein